MSKKNEDVGALSSNALKAIDSIKKFLADEKDLEIETLGDTIDFPYWIDSGNIALNLINTGLYNACIPGTKVIDINGDPSCLHGTEKVIIEIPEKYNSFFEDLSSE